MRTSFMKVLGLTFSVLFSASSNAYFTNGNNAANASTGQAAGFTQMASSDNYVIGFWPNKNSPIDGTTYLFRNGATLDTWNKGNPGLGWYGVPANLTRVPLYVIPPSTMNYPYPTVAPYPTYESPYVPVREAIPTSTAGMAYARAYAADAKKKAKVIGYIDNVVYDKVTRQYSIRGWACDRNVDKSITVHVYLGLPASFGGKVKAYDVADYASEAAVGRKCYSIASHRFRVVLSEALYNQYANSGVYVYGISLTGHTNRELDRSGKKLKDLLRP